MEPVDVGYKAFKCLMGEVEKYKDTIYTEQDTRIKIIDRIFIEVLGWPYSEIHTEEKTGSGYLDYKFTVNEHARLIVEAKRDGNTLGLKTRSEGRAYKLNGAVFKDKIVAEGIEQAIRYCGHKNSELACVTNGREWVIFRGSRLGDGIDTYEGMAFVFSSLGAIEKKFSLFYDLLSCESVSKYRFRVFFQEEEGQPIRPHIGGLSYNKWNSNIHKIKRIRR